MKISSWNVNSVRARISNIIEYLKNSKVDILMMQEIKTENINFPTDVFKKIGYSIKHLSSIRKRFIVKAFQRRYRPELINGKIDRELCYIAKKISNSLA